MHCLVSELYPICRSITGDGVRKTLNLMLEHIPLTICEVPSGLRCSIGPFRSNGTFEMHASKISASERIVDFRASNLHVLGYSVPVHTRIGL
jgi:aminopeptidase-like protein